jgi:catechol 2,3-dioxygenase-like lactoylglutathione lyase family enzyme
VTATGLHHAGLVVADLERALGFYHGLLGIPVRGRTEADSAELTEVTGWVGARALIADLELGDGRVLELIQRVEPHAPGPAAGTGHIALAVDDIDDAWRRVTGAGWRARSRPVTLRDAGPDWDGLTIVYVEDPDGNAVELVETPRG